MRTATTLGMLLIVASVASCGDKAASPPAISQVPAPAEFVAAQRGKVVVALLGMPGCGGTEKATAVLERLAPDMPPDVCLARVDVPPPAGPGPAPGLARVPPTPFYHCADRGRELARRLEFFFYPTLYVLDREGEVRYSGECEEGSLRRMVAEILAEAPGTEKRLYTPPLPAVGSAAPAVGGKGLDGGPVEDLPLDAGSPTLLFFTSIACPFSAEALRGLAEMMLPFEGREVGLAAIEKSPSADAAKAVYAAVEVPGEVLHDAGGEISARYGVGPVPFYFVIDGAGKVAARGPYTAAAAAAALSAALGIAPAGGAEAKPEGAG